MKRSIFILTLIIVGLVVACGGGGTSTEKPDSRVGISAFAIQQPTFNCDAFISTTNGISNFHISWLWHTFGTNLDCVNRVIERDNLKSMQIHIVNESCMDNRPENCTPDEFFDMDENRYRSLIDSNDAFTRATLEAAAQGINDVVSRLPRSVACYISPGLESNLSAQQMQKVISWIRPFLPSRCRYVARRGAEITEFHHLDMPLPTPCIYNEDGRTVTLAGISTGWPLEISEAGFLDILDTIYDNCEVRFIWHNLASNCLVAFNPAPPRQRECRSDFFGPQADIVKFLEGN